MQPPKAEDATTATALIWIESTEEDAFDRADAQILLELADCVGVTLDRVRRLDERGTQARESERDCLLAEIAHRIFNPLQVARGSLDLLEARLGEQEERSALKEEIDNGELAGKISRSLSSIDEAILATEKLCATGTSVEEARIPVDLIPLVRDVVQSYIPLAEAEYSVVCFNGCGACPFGRRRPIRAALHIGVPDRKQSRIDSDKT